MHILVISSWYPNKSRPTHGIFNKDFVKAASLYHKVSVIHVCSNHKHNAHAIEIDEFTEDNVYHYVTYYKKITTPSVLGQFQKLKKTNILYNNAFQKVVQKFGKPDIIHLNVVLPAGIGAYKLSKNYQIPLVVNECWTGYMPEDGNYKGFINKYFTKKILKHAKVVMPVSEDLKQHMIQHQLNCNYQIVPNIIHFEYQPPLVKEATSKSLLHISTLDNQQKNIEGILRAFAIARNTEKELFLTIVGANPDPFLVKLVESLQLSSAVQFLGIIDKNELSLQYQTCIGLVMFSNYESFGLVLAECIAHGKPVITSICGGITNNISDKFGYTVKPKDEVALTSAILKLSKNPWLISEKEIKDFLGDYSLEKVAQKLDEIYKATSFGSFNK